MERTRINKYLSEQGFCSRREADRLIEAGKVLVDGKQASMGQQVTGYEEIICCGKIVSGTSEKRRIKPVFLAVNKPRGIVCTTSQRDRAMNIIELLQYPVRIYPVGRLDKESEGLILMTNQGELANAIIHAGNVHEKEYLVTVDKPITPSFLKQIREGVELKALNATTRACEAEQAGERVFKIVLTQGLNRQIRRMCQELGYHVVRLKRIRIMNIHLGRLKTGDYRKVTPQEQEELMQRLELQKKDRP